ncbi:MAG TPA: heparinase II/III family protein [Gemmatimonadaceae bacterium]|nr:heparinase II/III family protein [Gemmatimonadaceae bacterium]
MSVLLLPAQLDERRRAALGPLASLADSLAADLEPVLARELHIPPEKARMTRRGGRCETDGTFLEFDPFSPRAHRCPRCGAIFTDDAHYRWWIMGYQLWLAERSVHAAALFALRGDVRHRDFARTVLEGYAHRYLEYPNRDNVLGPTRVFFSTYLESIWLLQLVVAQDLLEMSTSAEWHRALGARLRERVIEPSVAIIASYDEGLSNRQVWNNAALLAAARALGQPLPSSALHGASGLVGHLTAGLLADGTWYEGENYHLFAHRGLWYGVATAAAAGVELPPALIDRFDEAFATPFLTALPDFTFPSRRDSQYAVSLRQWRFAELAELGHVRRADDGRLLGALATLYDESAPRHDTGRARSTAEAERNTPATSLSRADLGWRSLLFAAPSLPAVASVSPASVLMREQGLAILRRERGRTYAALDYGHSGAGHGHPDRLNFVLMRGVDRWLDDVGTGSYVDPSLHWYRSTLAHNAPLVNGRSQEREGGQLLAYEDRGAAGWVRAFADDVALGVNLERTIVAMSDYVVDELTWRSNRDVQVDLPLHVDGTLTGAGEWRSAQLIGGADVEDGFGFLTETERAERPDRSEGSPSLRRNAADAVDGPVRLDATVGASSATVQVFTDALHEWWRAVSFGAPGNEPARFHLVRATGKRGSIVSVWDLTGSVAEVTRSDGVTSVFLHDGTRHDHRPDAKAWHIALTAGTATSSIDLGGSVDVDDGQRRAALNANGGPVVIPLVIERAPVTTELGEREYRRSEQSWAEAGSPTATVSISADDVALMVTVDVRKPDLCFAPELTENLLDNENPDTNADGVQLHLVSSSGTDDRTLVDTTWLIVPQPYEPRVRVSKRAVGGDPPPLDAAWHRTDHGYTIRATIPRGGHLRPGTAFLLGVVVNETGPDRERRRGQLVFPGREGEFVYLRGDRLPRDRHFPFTIADA